MTSSEVNTAPVDGGQMSSSRDCPIVGVGASAGGMEAFTELLRAIPSDSGMAFVLIQHLDPTHASHLRDALSRITALPVEEIQDGTIVQPDRVYVLPSNADLGIMNGTLALLPRSAEPGKSHLAIDLFFKALAADRGEQAIGIVLSGTGSDGAEGLRAIRAAGGLTFAQDPKSARFGGMPEAAIESGVVDVSLPILELTQELLRMGRHFSERHSAHEGQNPTDDAELTKLLVLLEGATRVDFSEYKPASVRRRVRRRMALRRIRTIHDYVALLREDHAEKLALFEDILIHVTSFFREPAAFDALKANVFPEILKRKTQGGSIRIWSAGCSTGEEAYSLLMALVEFLAEANASEVTIQIFGTDLSEQAIERARAGLYPDSAMRDLDANRLGRFFTKVEGGYRVSASMRERCAFVKHDLTREPPFSKLDLVSCRNVLIYFGQELQRRVLTMFHFSLSQPGFLFLGHAENILDASNLFSVVDGVSKIFERTAVKSTLWLTSRGPALSPRVEGKALPAHIHPSTPVDVVRRTESLLLDRYAPPGVIVNERLEILHFRGRTGLYLEPAPGEPQNALLKMARNGLLADLRIATAEALKTNTAVRRPAMTVENDGTQRQCDVVVIPILAPPNSRERIFAVLFEAAIEERASAVPAPPLDERHLAKLDDELRANKEYLHSIIEEHQHTNEELTSANEELLSGNEELQTLNEEFQTAKEELQSTNEELITVNDEMRNRNLDLNTVNSDLTNVLASIDVPLVIVDGARRIRRFTAKVCSLLNLQTSDVGRPLTDIKPKLAVDSLDRKIAEVIASLESHEEEAKGDDGHWYRIQIRPYAAVDKRVDGAVLTIVDIDVFKKAVIAAEWTRDLAQAIVDAVQLPEVVLDERLNILSVNEAFTDKYGLSKADAKDKSIYAVIGGAFDIPSLRTGLERVAAHDERMENLELTLDVGQRGMRSILFSGRGVVSPTSERIVLLSADDITERKLIEQDAARLLEAAPDAVVIANRSGDIVRINAQTERLFGYTRAELVGEPVELLIPARFSAGHPRHRERYGNDPEPRPMAAEQDLYARRKDGVEFPVEISLSPSGAGESLLVSAAVRDISARKAIETELRRSLTEKEVLLKEVHHRVKNNLQVISSMLKLHAEQANEGAAQAFQDSQDRVRSIALLHETLYQSKDLGNVDLYDYAEGLVRVHQRSTVGAVSVTVHGEHILVPLTLAVPCGLILHELVTNAFKHAFPDPAKADSVIDILFQHNAAGIELTVSDNGIGLAAGAAVTAKSLGMHLMRTLARQVDGTLSFEVRNGTRCKFQFSGKES